MNRDGSARTGRRSANDRRRLFCGIVALALFVGCAPRQIVPLALEPRDVTVYVDRQAVEGTSPDHLELRADRPHVLLFRKPGYQAEQVVLRSERVNGAPALRPERIEVRLKRLAPTGRRLDVELEEAEEEPRSGE